MPIGKIKQYEKTALGTELKDYVKPQIRLQEDTVTRLLHCALGLSGEAGEFTDSLKKHVFYGKALDRTNLIEELGDLTYYIAVAANALDSNLAEVLKVNEEKLKARYKNGFSEEAATNRNLKKERSILEKNTKKGVKK